MVQYPIKKMRLHRTIQNVMPDGSTIVLADPPATKLIWDLRFDDLSTGDINALQTFFQSCCGPYRAFTFIDPTDNMFAASADLTASSWLKDPGIQITANASDPAGGSQAFVVTNTASSPQSISQVLTVPSGYQYCLSLFASTAQATNIELFRRGAAESATDDFQITPNWTRIISSGQFSDGGTQLTAGVTLAAGQQVTLFGLQLEPQIQPTRYRATLANGGVYSSAHWASSSLAIVATAPGLFSAALEIQTNV
jgi:hypothetical protein